MESWKRFVPQSSDLTDEERVAQQKEIRLEEERLALEQQLAAAEDEEARQYEVINAKRRRDGDDDADLPQPKGMKANECADEDVIVSDSESDQEADDEEGQIDGTSESVESLLSLIHSGNSKDEGAASTTQGAAPRTILSPEEKTEVLLLIKHMLNVCESGATAREKRLQVTPLASRMIDLLPATKEFFAAHGWRGLRFKKKIFNSNKLMKKLIPLKGLEDAVFTKQDQGKAKKVSYAEAADQAVLKRTVFVTGLPADTLQHASELSELFEGYGALAQPIALGANVDPRLAETALVQYQAPSSASKAQNLDGILFRGQPLAVTEATAVQMSALGVPLPSAKVKATSVRAPMQPSEEQENKATLLVKGLPSEGVPLPYLEYYLMQLFRPYGPFVYAINSGLTGGGCSAIVQYQKEENAISAVQRVNGVSFYGSRIIVHYATVEEIHDHGPLRTYQPPTQCHFATAGPAIQAMTVPQIHHQSAVTTGQSAVLQHGQPPVAQRNQPALGLVMNACAAASAVPQRPLARGKGGAMAGFAGGRIPGKGSCQTPQTMNAYVGPSATPTVAQRKKEIQAKKQVDSFLSDYEAFYAKQVEQELANYETALASGALATPAAQE